MTGKAKCGRTAGPQGVFIFFDADVALALNLYFLKKLGPAPLTPLCLTENGYVKIETYLFGGSP